MGFTTELLATILIKRIGEFKNLMEFKCQKRQYIKIKAQMRRTVTIIMIYVIIGTDLRTWHQILMI